MDTTSITDSLNAAQKDAVTADAVPLLVLAGAGSGKTRVLVHRAAWLVATGKARPSELFAVTFTNKAANEMRSRIEHLIDAPARQLWVGTFHGLAHRFLRIHHEEANLPKDFQIIDTTDQLRLIKRLIKDEKIDEERIPPKLLQYYIADAKEEGLRPDDLDPQAVRYGEDKLRLYRLYEQRCQHYGLVDFGELLLRVTEMFASNAKLLSHYRERFGWLLIDEFQDTNAVQYNWLRLLCGDKGVPFAVGDDDQSIYAWRGAQVENMRRFTKDFPNCEVVRLERNYRSTGNILRAANSVISNNDSRFSKELWTEDGDGAPIDLYLADNAWDEARHVMRRIKRRRGAPLSNFAILYRSNAQSRIFEEVLVGEGIPYRVYGGMRFFERAEVKDALSYLRLAVNPGDDPSFERIVNNPSRRIGLTTVQVIRDHARANNLSMWEAADAANDILRPAAAKAVWGFIQIMNKISRKIEGADELSDKVRIAVEDSGLMDRLRHSTNETDQMRAENLDELINAAAMMEEALSEQSTEPLNAFLAHAALESGDDRNDGSGDAVQLMTMHAAKGLEFPVVFLTGLEEGLFPHSRSMDTEAEIEEERRLCYVGITRAMKELNITLAESRQLHGQWHHNEPSRFLEELPSELADQVY